MIRRQKLEIRLNDGPPVRWTLRRRFPETETIAIEHDFTIGSCRLKINVDRWVESPEGRKLGVIVVAVQFGAEPEARKRLALAELGSMLPFRLGQRVS
jgi:hypothetical protein